VFSDYCKMKRGIHVLIIQIGSPIGGTNRNLGKVLQIPPLRQRKKGEGENHSPDPQEPCSTNFWGVEPNFLAWKDEW